MSADERDIIGTPNLGPLFAASEERTPLYPSADFVDAMNKTAALDVDHPAPRGRATVSGGKSAALAAIAPHLTGLRGRVYAGIVAYGPATRETLAETLGMKKDTVNGRCAELIKAKLVRISGYERVHGRGLLEAVPTESSGNPRLDPLGQAP